MKTLNIILTLSIMASLVSCGGVYSPPMIDKSKLTLERVIGLCKGTKEELYCMSNGSIMASITEKLEDKTDISRLGFLEVGKYVSTDGTSCKIEVKKIKDGFSVTFEGVTTDCVKVQIPDIPEKQQR